jgi:hypothetical protein
MMDIKGKCQLLRIFIGEADRYEGNPLYEAIIYKAKEAGIAGVTVIRGIEGYGAGKKIHKTRAQGLVRLSKDLPVLIEMIDTAERIQEILPVIDPMVTKGLIAQEDVNVIAYRHQE